VLKSSAWKLFGSFTVVSFYISRPSFQSASEPSVANGAVVSFFSWTRNLSVDPASDMLLLVLGIVFLRRLRYQGIDEDPLVCINCYGPGTIPCKLPLAQVVKCILCRLR
jgi:hypothetical protein